MKLNQLLSKGFQSIVLIGFLSFSGAARSDSYTEFFRAIELDRAAVVQSLLDRGFPVNAPNGSGQPAFVLALRTPSPKVAEVLWQHRDFDLHQATPAGETPLMIAALIGDAAWTKRLLERGSRLDSDSGWTALHYAASGQNPHVLELLLAGKPPLNPRAPNGNTPLMMAAMHGDQRNADALLAGGADARLVNRAGNTAADLARAQGRDRLAERIARAAAAAR
jgi:uncharacterized protein